MNICTTVIKSRQSVRSYKPDPVDDLVIREVLECARLAPTAMNRQDWVFLVIRDPVMLSKLAGLTEHGKFIAQAPVCFAIFGKRAHVYYLEDCCAATENLILALQAHGVGSCWVAGDKKAYAGAVRELLNVPGEFSLVSLVSAGYPGDVKVVAKKPMSEVVFYELYGNPPVR
ncbi:MAG: nitroreductase family protein [Methanomicrobiales archaeon]|nr:nitroreductase family protein [Methanomicrobiales archaeon]